MRGFVINVFSFWANYYKIHLLPKKISTKHFKIEYNQKHQNEKLITSEDVITHLKYDFIEKKKRNKLTSKTKTNDQAIHKKKKMLNE